MIRNKRTLYKMYRDAKKEHPHKIVLIGNQNWYESFGVDALDLHKYLGLVITWRKDGENEMPMAGFPKEKAVENLQILIKECNQKVVIL